MKITLIVVFAIWSLISLVLLYYMRQSRIAKAAAAEVAALETQAEQLTTEQVDEATEPVNQSDEQQPDVGAELLGSEKEKENVSAGTDSSNKTMVEDRSDQVANSDNGSNDNTQNGAGNSDNVSAPEETLDSSETISEAHPDVDETAVATVAKNSNGKSSRKRKRSKSKRKQTAAASTAAAASQSKGAKSDEAAGSDASTSSSSSDTANSDESNSTSSENNSTNEDDSLQADTDATNTDSTKTESESPVTIDALLKDVELPYDLRSVSDTDLGAGQHVTFVSSHSDAAAVGTAFADELERVGFIIEPAGDDEAIAKRDGDTLTMRITPEAGASGRYPELASTDVVIETWVL